MISFLVCLAILIAGYFVYGKVVEKVFGPDDRETPAVALEDGVDYVVLPEWRIFMIQLLNIAGLGPIWGAVGGAMWGPSVFLWITFGTIFAGGVHDFASGFMSMRNKGMSISEVCGDYMGNVMRNIMRVFSVILLFMVGVVFAKGPAGLLAYLCGKGGGTNIKIKEKQEKEKKIKDKILERKNKQKILYKIWEEDLIPNWYKIKNSPEIAKYFYLGLPDNIRGKIWILCLGNKFSITKEYYDIEVKKSLEIINEINQKKTTKISTKNY